MTGQFPAEFNALPDDWASDPVLVAGLTVDDDDEHDDPVLRWPDGGSWIPGARITLSEHNPGLSLPAL